MKSDLESVAAFARIVQEGSFTAAGRAMGIGPSAVSKKVARLEDQLGVSLLNRTTRKLILTNAGQEFFERCSRGLSEISSAEEAVQQLRKTPQGLLRIKLPQGFGPLYIVPLIPKFMALYPRIEIDLSFGQWDSGYMDKSVDVIISSADPANINLASRALAQFERVTCASPGYIDRHGKPRDQKDLANYNCLMFTDSTSIPHEWIYYHHNAINRVHISGNFRTNSTDAMISAVTEGLGIAHMPAFAVGAAVAAGKLAVIFRDGSRGERVGPVMKAYFPPAKHRLPKVKVFVDFLVKSLAASPLPKHLAG